MKPVSINQISVENFIDSLMDAFREGDPDALSKTTEAENVRHLQEQYRAIARGDFGPVVAGLDEDIDMEMIGPSEIPLVGHWRGRERVAEAIQRNFSLLADQQAEILAVVAQGDMVVLFAREQGVFRATGKRYDIHWAQWFTFRDGKIIRFRGLLDSAAMLDAVRS